MNTGTLVSIFHFIFMVKGEVMFVKGHTGTQWEYRFIHSFIFSALGLEGLSTQRPSLFASGKNPSTHRTEGCLGPTDSIDGCGE